MASGIASESILFIGALIAAAAVAGVMTAIAFTMAGGIEARGDADAERLATDITIINDPVDVTANPGPVLLVKNTGSRTIAVDDVSVIFNGAIITSATNDVLESTDDTTWPPGAVLQITVTSPTLGTGDHRVQVVAGAGVNDRMAWSQP